MKKLTRAVLIVIAWLFFWPYLGSRALVEYAFVRGYDEPLDDIIRVIGLVLQMAYLIFPIVLMINYSVY